MSHFESYISEIVTAFISSIITAFGSWFYSRQRQKKEVKALEVDLVERAAKIWREMSEELKERLDKVEEENKELRTENKGLRKEIEALRKRVTTFVKKYGDNGDQGH